MQRILLCADGSSFARTSCILAAWFATRSGAEVEVLCVTDERHQAAAAARNYSGSIGLGASEALMSQLVKLERYRAQLEHQRSQLILKDARDLLTAAGVDRVKLIHETGLFFEYFQVFEAEADLVVLGKRGENSKSHPDRLGGNLERVVRASHKPCLVASSEVNPIERLLLAYDGSQSCQKMLHFLVYSPNFQGLELHIITVAKQDEDARAIAHLEEARQAALAAGFSPICQQLVGNAEEEIASYSEKHHVDLLMMGAYGHSRIRHLVIGSTTAQILRSSHIPVLVFR